MSRKILLTGGTGYIGSHTVVQLLNAGLSVVVLDNFHNSSPKVIERIQKITGTSFDFVEGDIRDHFVLQKIFKNHAINAVIHFAGFKAVGESESNPIKYYDNNVGGSIALFEEMAKANVYNIVFSSSATVYGNSAQASYREDMPLAPINVYGRNKQMIETILCDLKKAQKKWRIALLRYFNPIGAHVSGLIGESPIGIPNNLVPFISQVAVGKREKLFVFGNQYPTKDGTALRDYIHVDDLARAHLAALTALDKEDNLIIVNLGTGQPYSVLEMVAAFEKASGQPIPYEIVAPRDGDLDICYADPKRSYELLGWKAHFDLTRMCEDTWRWQKNNPNGYS